MNPVPLIVRLALVVSTVVVLLALVRTSWSYGTQIVVLAGFGAATALVAVRYERRLPRNGPEPADPDEVMPGARAAVEEFESAGFRRLGGFRWALRGRLVISTVLAPDALDRYAIATDRVLEVACRFGDLSFITTNSGRAPLPGDVLRQVVRDGSASELAEAHQIGLGVLAGHGLEPDRFRDDDDVLRHVRAVEERALRQVRIPSLAVLLAREWSGERDRELGLDGDAPRRITAWLGARTSKQGA